MEELHFNITVGLLSMGPALLYAENGTAEGNVETRTAENVWVYEPLVLIVVYAAAAAIDALVIGVGLWAAAENGGTSGLNLQGFLRRRGVWKERSSRNGGMGWTRCLKKWRGRE